MSIIRIVLDRLNATGLRLAASVLLVVWATASGQQSVKLQGLIEGRSGPTIILRAADSTKVIVLLTDHTNVGQVQGVLKARRKDMSMAALIPGLQIEAEGTYDGQTQLVAKSIKFKGDDLQRAKSIQAGLRETHAQSQRNRDELEKQNAALQSQNESLKQQQEQLTAAEKTLAANRAAIEGAVARFGQLDDYYILDETIVYFGNGKTALEPQYKTQLAEFAERARKVDAYMVQVVGYASASGSEEVNQKLSEDRAHAVTNHLLQRCAIPLTNVMAPGAMGESQQVTSSSTADGEATNRRVVVRVLQNKGVAGLASAAK
jgi:outer membrane protein OmpA-like peptidoglycan-associated protein